MVSRFFELLKSDTPTTPITYAKEPTRTLQLDEADWLWATWRKSAPKIKPAARAFDISSVQNSPPAPVNWYQAPLDLVLSTDEALYWLSVVLGKNNPKTSLLSSLQSELQQNKDANKLTLVQMKEIVRKSSYDDQRAVALIPMQVLSALLTPDDLVVWLCESPTILSAFTEFRKRVLLFLNQDEKERLKELLKPYLDLKAWYTDNNMAFYLAAGLGMHDETRTLVESWSEDYGPNGWHLRLRVLQYIVFGLSSADEVEKHIRRLKLELDETQFILGWFAHTEHRALDKIVAALEAKLLEKEKLPKLLAALAVMDAPEVAPIMFECASKYRSLWKKEPPMYVVENAETWLNKYPLNCAIGLLPFIGMASPAQADEIITFLRKQNREGHSAAIKAAQTYMIKPIERVTNEVLNAEKKKPAALDGANIPAWLEQALPSEQQNTASQIAGKTSSGKKSEFPEWLVIEELPPLIVDECRLNYEHLELLLTQLKTATSDHVPPIVPLLWKHVSKANLEDFVLHLFNSWHKYGAPNQDRWVLHALGQLGGDRAALSLPRLIREWRAGSNQPHALAGLDALKRINSDTALMQMNAIANDRRLKALREKATAFMNEIAAGLGLSYERLEDRLIPSCGLDDPELSLLDLGSRKFFLNITPELQPALKDESGKTHRDLPAATQSDDAAKVKDCSERWKLFKRDLKSTSQFLAERLEQAMICERSWFVDEFEKLLVRHPVALHVLRGLLWAAFDTAAKSKAVFRITAEGVYCDLNNEAIKLDRSSEVIAVHPLQLPPELLSSWTALFDNLEIAQPFPQLKREVHTLSETELEQFQIERIKGYLIPALSIPSILDKRGWVRGAVESGYFCEHTKYFPAADLTAICLYEGAPVLFQDGGKDQQIDHCFFVPGKVIPSTEREFKGACKLAEVNSIVVSEVMHDLFLLSKKAKTNAYE